VATNEQGQAPTAEQRLEAELKQAREAVDDLKQQVGDLETQLAALSRLRAIEGGTGGESGGTPPPAGVVPPPAAGTTALLKRTAKRAIRGTLGVARTVWGAADPAQRHIVAVRPSDEAGDALPSLTVVVEADEIPEYLVRQTIEEFEVALWDRIEGTLSVLTLDGVQGRRSTARTRDEMLELMSGDSILWLPARIPELPATLLETLRWVVASEAPLYVRLPASPGGGETHPSRMMIAAARTVWTPDLGVDLERLAAAAADRPMVGKTVGLAGDMDVAVPGLGSLGPGSHGVVCRTGRYDVWAGNTKGPVEHRVLQLPPASPDEHGRPEDRPAVLVVAASLSGGFDDLVAGAVAALVDHADPVVATTAAASDLDLRRAALLERFDVPVYELGTSVDSSVWPSALERIAIRNGVDRCVVVGTDRRVERACEAWIARGMTVVKVPGRDGPIPAGWPLAARVNAVPEFRRHAVRSEIGVGPERHMVVVAADLVPSSRVEDVVAVAEELRGQRETVFVVVGEGPLTGHVFDLIRYLDLDNVHLRRPIHDLCDLVAAADLVLDVSEDAPVRSSLVAALAAGTPVVATPGTGFGELLEATGGTGLVTASVGAPREIADAVRRMRSSVSDPPDGDDVRHAIRERKRTGTRSFRAAVLGPDHPSVEE
jgi:glycosyltransferase involved in cell wall biosynthesis